ncbi:MAG: hypothetical protein IT580_05360 [Verrucomicrobiales bacterium]|nr:hypothetical protein [Verrucomicrobiales bacterium]
MQRRFPILLWTLPERYVSIFCGVSGFVLWLAVIVGCFLGDGGDGLLFLLLGVVSLVGIRPRQAGRLGP